MQYIKKIPSNLFLNFYTKNISNIYIMDFNLIKKKNSNILLNVFNANHEYYFKNWIAEKMLEKVFRLDLVNIWLDV